MQTARYPILLLCLLLWPAVLSAQPYSSEHYLSMIEAYVDKVVNIYDGNWAYTYKSNDKLDAESLTWRRDPSLPFLESDQLIAVNDAMPDAGRLERHERRMHRRLQRRQEAQQSHRSIVEEERQREGEEKERFLALIIPDSIRFVKQEGDLHYLEFRGMEENRRSIYENLVGTLILDTKNEFIRELQIRVIQPFNTFLVVRINSGYFSLRFNLVNGRPVQTDATWQLDGHVLFVRDLERDEELQWFDLRPVTPAEES